MKAIPFTIGLLMSCSVVASAWGQFDPFMYGNNWGGVYGHASTVEEGAARGMADVVRSAGLANMMNAQAASTYQDAVKKNIDNRMSWTNAYFDMKRVNQESRRALKGPAPSQEQLVKAATDALPDRLTQSKLDPVTGSIKWPVALRDSMFEEYRVKLEGLYAQREKNGYLSPDQYLQVKSTTKEMKGVLQENVRKYPTSASIEARKFIDSLAYEADFDPVRT